MRTRVAIAIIVLLTMVAYFNAFRAGFIWDDDDYVRENPVLESGTGLMEVWIPRRTPQYYPLVFTSFWIEHAIWGDRAMGYHCVNVALHALNACLLLIVLRRLAVPGALLISILFAIHPVHVESVAWISERKNVLSLTFLLASALTFLRFEDCSANERECTSKTWLLYVGSLALFIAALLSKTVTCFLPVALILARLWRHKPITLKFLAWLIPFFVIGAALGLHTAFLERTFVQAIGPNWDYSLLERTQIAARALLFYPQKLIAPSPLIFIYPKWAIGADIGKAYIPIVIVLCIAVAAVAIWRRGCRAPLLALALYAAAIFPALGYFNTYPMLYSFVADHFQYHASIGVLALLVGGLITAIRSRMLLLAVGVAIVTPLVLLTTQQCNMYLDQCTVWAWTLRFNDHADIAHNNLGVCFKQNGDMESAELHFRRAIDLRADAQESWVNLYDVLMAQHRCDEAARIAERLTMMEPGSAAYHYRAGLAYDCLGQDGEATIQYERALELDGARPEPHVALAVLLLRAGDAKRAQYHAELGVAMAEHEVWNRIVFGRALQAVGRSHEAVDELESALQDAHRLSDRVEAIGALVEILAASPDPSAHDGPRAVALAEALCDLVGRDSPQALNVLAMAHARNGTFDAAVTVATEARDLAIHMQMHELAEDIKTRLNLYQNKQAWIQTSH